MADTASSLRQLKIKTGVVSRLFKEEQTYRTEAADQEKVLAKLRDSGADGADIRNAERVLKDSEQMIPRTQKSLQEARDGLKDLVDALGTEDSINATDEYKAAVAILDKVGQA
ncbi:putative Co-chaperone [Kockovaella imperatae]|uniref:Tubulin-specific chaperone A n=1 Tax=Kockovaella imperatae TaxID=4999 RepID=A0A1Y1UQI5_9TREE|nr:putative Co-chaperone [Kockovaella imperatae]ORX40232.1 putative Co-chaperone [Kockovaella imperatae]